MKNFEFLDSPTVALLVALSIGLAIAVHPVFLVLGFLVTIAVLIEALAHAIGKHTHHANPAYRHP
jgi:hypothetical protein